MRRRRDATENRSGARKFDERRARYELEEAQQKCAAAGMGCKGVTKVEGGWELRDGEPVYAEGTESIPKARYGRLNYACVSSSAS